jgi:hypothetical protein
MNPMKANSRETRVKSRTMRCLAICLALAAPIAMRAQAQCYIDPVTGQRVCMTAPESRDSVYAPALDSGLSTLDHSAHCRISVADGSTGSGTLVAVGKSVGLVLSCSHLFDSSTDQIVVTFPNGGRFAARLIDRDRAHDLSALAIRPPNITPLVVSDEDPAGTLTACGFGPTGQFRCVHGGVTGQATAVGATYPSLTISGAVRPGDSGGGVLNTRGQLVGVVWGQRDGHTYATCGRPLREFLDRIRGRTEGGQAPARAPGFDWQARFNEFDQRIRALDATKQDKGDYLQRSDLNGFVRTGEVPQLDTSQFARRSELDGGLKSMTARFESVRQHVAEVAASKGGFFQGLSFGKLIVGALGLSGPLAAAVIVAGGLAGRRLKRTPLRATVQRLAATRSGAHHEPAYEPIVVDSPIPPQRTVPETHYVPIEKDSFAKAHQWASEHVARKYPGGAEILQAQDSLIKQYLSAH